MKDVPPPRLDARNEKKVGIRHWSMSPAFKQRNEKKKIVHLLLKVEEWPLVLDDQESWKHSLLLLPESNW